MPPQSAHLAPPAACNNDGCCKTALHVTTASSLTASPAAVSRPCAISPDVSAIHFDAYTLTVSKGNTPLDAYNPPLPLSPKELGNNTVSFPVSLPVGSYNVTVNGYVDGVLVATATTPLVVKRSGASTCSLTLVERDYSERPSTGGAPGADGDTGVDPTIAVSGKVVVENPARVDIGAVTLTDTITFSQTKAALEATDERGTSTYNYTLTLPWAALGARPAIVVTFAERFPNAPDVAITAPPALTTDNASDVNFNVSLYALTADIINNPTSLAAFVDNRVVDKGTNTIYLKGDITGADLTTLGKAIGAKSVRVDMSGSIVTDNTFPAGAFAACSGLTGIVVDGVGGVPGGAFAGCAGLESVTIGKGVKTIADGVFADCSNLKNIAVDRRNKAYTSFDNTLYTSDNATLVARARASGVTSFVVPSGVTTIGSYAFRHIDTLKSVFTGNGVDTIGVDAFRDCSGLENVSFGDGLRDIGDGAFKNCVKLTTLDFPERTHRLGAGAFEGCKGLTGVTLPRYASDLGAGMFRNCTALRSVGLSEWTVTIPDYAFEHCPLEGDIVIPGRVTGIGANAFAGCTAMKSVSFPNTLHAIGAGAFKDCVAFKSVSIPGSVESIGDDAFANCNNIKDATLGYGVKTIGNRAFMNCFLDNYEKSFLDISYSADWDEMIIPDSVVRIGDDAFSNCHAIRKLVISKNLTHLGTGAFFRCYGVNKVVIPGSLKRVGDHAFDECQALRNIVFEEGVEVIGKYAFRYCYSADYYEEGRDVIINKSFNTPITFANSIRSIEDRAFEDCKYALKIVINPKIKLGSMVLAGCASLESITLGADIQVPIGANTNFDKYYADAGRKGGRYKIFHMSSGYIWDYVN
jgi:hypothetical protein